MDTSVKAILEKTAKYIELTQPTIDAYNAKRERFVKRAHQTAGVLVSRGLLSRENVDEFIDKVAANETEVWDLVDKLSSTVCADELGKSAQVAGHGKPLDAFERLALYGDSNADTRQPGMVD